MITYFASIPSVFASDLESIFDRLRTKYSAHYKFSNYKIISQNLVATLNFTEKYVHDWQDRWPKTPGVGEMSEILKGDFSFEMLRSGNIKISCSNYRKDHAEFIKPELLFHFRDLCHNLADTLRELGVCPCTLRRGVDCIGEDLNIGNLAEEFRSYLRAVLNEAIDLFTEVASHFEQELSSILGRIAPFIGQIGLKDQVKLFELSSLHSRETKDLHASVKRACLETKEPYKNEWTLAELDVSSLTDFFSDLSGHLGFMLGVYSNQTSAVGMYVGISGLSASILIFSQSLDINLRTLVSTLSGFVLILTCLRWYRGHVSDMVRAGIFRMRQQISSRLN